MKCENCNEEKEPFRDDDTWCEECTLAAWERSDEIALEEAMEEE